MASASPDWGLSLGGDGRDPLLLLHLGQELFLPAVKGPRPGVPRVRVRGRRGVSDPASFVLLSDNKLNSSHF